MIILNLFPQVWSLMTTWLSRFTLMICIKKLTIKIKDIKPKAYRGL